MKVISVPELSCDAVAPALQGQLLLDAIAAVALVKQLDGVTIYKAREALEYATTLLTDAQIVSGKSKLLNKILTAYSSESSDPRE